MKLKFVRAGLTIGYERVLPYLLENDPRSMLLKALIYKGFAVVQQALLTQIVLKLLRNYKK